MKDKIHNELNEIAPTLARLEKVNPFKVPNGYFSSLENRTLDTLGKKSMMNDTLPEGYFDGLSNQILERVEKEEKTKIIPIYRRAWLSIAASFILIAGAVYLMNTPSNQINNQSEFVLDIDPEEALDYLIEKEDLYLSDLLSLNLDEINLGEKTSDFELLEDTDLDNFLNELNQEDLEDLEDLL